MADKKLSSPDKTKVRIARDKREFDRLFKELQHRLVEGHSPSLSDILEDELWDDARYIAYAEVMVDNSYNADAREADEYLYHVNDTISRDQATDAREADEYLYHVNDTILDELAQDWDEGMSSIYFATDRVTSYLMDEEEIVNYNLTGGEDTIVVVVDEEVEVAKDALSEGEGFWEMFSGNWMEAIVEFPKLIITISKLLDSFVNLDPEKFVEDNLELAKAQKRLQERLPELGD